MTRDQLILSMTEAKFRLIQRKKIPRAFYLTADHYVKFGRDHLDYIPVRQANGKRGSCIYSTAGTSVAVTPPDGWTRKERLR